MFFKKNGALCTYNNFFGYGKNPICSRIHFLLSFLKFFKLFSFGAEVVEIKACFSGIKSYFTTPEVKVQASRKCNAFLLNARAMSLYGRIISANPVTKFTKLSNCTQ